MLLREVLALGEMGKHIPILSLLLNVVSKVEQKYMDQLFEIS